MSAPGAARVAELREALRTGLPGRLGIVLDEAGEGTVRASMAVTPAHMAPNGYLHAASLIALADTACGIGCWLGLPADGAGFTTVELKSNFVGAARDGVLTCDARRSHGGRSTEVWDAEVRGPSGRPVALFRCTQLLLSGGGAG